MPRRLFGGGRIIEHGTHQKLLAQRGFYYRLTSGRYGETADDAVVIMTAGGSKVDKIAEIRDNVN